MWADPAVRRFLFDDEPVPRTRAAAILARCLRQDGGLGLWCIVSPAADVIGCVGLLPVTTSSDYAPSLAGAVEPLVALKPDGWGRGYATEALNDVIRYGFETLRLPALAAVVDVPNVASDRLLRRLGFTVTGECDGPRYRMRTFSLASAPLPVAPNFLLQSR